MRAILSAPQRPRRQCAAAVGESHFPKNFTGAQKIERDFAPLAVMRAELHLTRMNDENMVAGIEFSKDYGTRWNGPPFGNSSQSFHGGCTNAAEQRRSRER
jgi:hypothetical protein